MNVRLGIRLKGFALIEALIAFVVVATGLMALAPLYSDMMGGSSLSKARAEALEAARGQNEILRNFALKGQFDRDLVDGSRSWTGKNATFTMTWTVTDPTGGENYKNIATAVTWTDPNEGTQTVTLPTQIRFNDPALSAAIQDRALCAKDPSKCRSLDSPWTSGVEGPHVSTPGQALLGSPVVDNQGTDASADDVTLKTYDGGNVEVIYDGRVRFTAFGGVVHRIRGRIWLTPNARTQIDPSGRDTDALDVLATSPSWCLFPICDDPGGTCEIVDRSERRSVTYRLASYVCYVSGDCTNGGIGCSCIECDDPGEGPNCCAEGESGFDAAFQNRSFNGGWYGAVGNFSVFLDPDDSVCTMDTSIAGGDTLRLTPSRQYATYRVASSGAPASCTASGVVSAVETRLDPWPDDPYNAYQPDQDQPIGPIENDLTRAFKGFCVSGTPKAMTSTEGINAPFAYQDFLIGTKNEINSDGCATLSTEVQTRFRERMCASLCVCPPPEPPPRFNQALPPSSLGRALEADSVNRSLPENLSYGAPCPECPECPE